MCTLAVSFGQYPEWPLVVAANRDERLDRPASPPRVWPGDVPFLAPRDEVAGGSWVGVNGRGLFVGITNRFGSEVDRARTSRGVLVLEALRHPSAEALHRALGELPASRFNPFHLLYADRRAAFVTWSDGRSVRQERLDAGLHVVTERSLGGDDRARAELVRAQWQVVDGPHPPAPEALQDLMRQHGAGDPVGGTCVHVPEWGFGTRSSLVLFLGADPARSRLFWAEGSPCTNPYVELSSLMRGL